MLLLINFVSCSFFNTEVIEIEPQKSKIVVFCEIFNDESWFQTVVLSRTRNIGQAFRWDFDLDDTIGVGPNGAILNNGSIRFDTVNGAKIKLISDGMELTKFKQLDKFIKSFYSADSILLKEGSKCQLSVSSPDFDTIFSEQIVPKTVKLVSAKFKKNGFQSLKSGVLNLLELEFSNDPTTLNYYTVDVYSKILTSNDYYFQKTKTIKIDPNADTPEFISSKNFKASRYVWQIGVDFQDAFGDQTPKYVQNIAIKFRSTSKEFTEYAKNREVINICVGRDGFSE